jgi:hypothetical protein
MVSSKASKICEDRVSATEKHKRLDLINVDVYVDVYLTLTLVLMETYITRMT